MRSALSPLTLALSLTVLYSVLVRCDDFGSRRIFVSVGSDDWGRWSNSLPVWPNREEREASVREMGWLTGGMPMLSTVESEADLLNLKAFLQELNDGVPWRQRVVISPYWVVGGPDYAAMAESGCPDADTCEYRELMWHNSTGGLDRAPYNRGDLRAHYKALFEEGLWHPEYHGRSHFDTRAWVAYLRGGDAFSRYYFRRGMTFYHYGFKDPQTGSTHTLHCEYLADDAVFQKSEEETQAWVREGVASFEAFWGYAPRVTSAPTHHAPEWLGGVLAEEGFLAIEGNELDFLHSVPRFEVDLDSWLQMGGVAAVRAEAERQRAELRRRLAGEGLLALQWHAQNAMGGMYGAEEAALLLGEFAATVRMLREEYPGLVVVTAAELAQIQAQGWSVEVWAGRLVVRNYNAEPLEWRVPDMAEWDRSIAAGQPLRMRVVGEAGGEGEEEWEVAVGETVVIGADSEAELVLAERRGSTASGGEERGTCAGGTCQGEAGGAGKGEAGEWETGLYYARVYGDRVQVRALEEAGRVGEVVELGLRLQRRMAEGQQAALAEACERCAGCRSCLAVADAALQAFDAAGLPALRETELFEEGVWQDRTAVRDPARFGEVSITFLAPRFGDHVESPGFVAVDIAGYDFEAEGGYAVLAAGGFQVSAWRGPHLEIALFGARGHIPQNIIVALVGPDGRPLGVANNVVFWETAMSNPPRPGPKPTTNATSLHTAPWHPDRPAAPPAPADLRRWGEHWLQPPPAARAPPGARVALVITSCVAVDGRLTLLEETVRSFLAANTYPIDQYILIDDSGDPEVHRRLLLLFGSLFDVLLNRRGRTGMTFSIDSAYAHVSADYIFHCQDDWLFHTRGNFIQESLSVLRHVEDALVVWCRDHRDHDLPMGPPLRTPDGVPFHKVLPMSLWKGFSFNPGLRRVSDWKMMAPIQRYWFEDYVQGFMRWMGMYGVSLTQGWTRHTGEHHSTKPSYQAANEELARLKQGKGTL